MSGTPVTHPTAASRTLAGVRNPNRPANTDRQQGWLTNWELACRLFAGYNCTVEQRQWIDTNLVAHTGYVQSVEREDGSGRSFNIVICREGKSTKLHIKTKG